MNKNSKIYVAGHTGLVGSAIRRCLTDNGYSNILTTTYEELDLTRQLDVERFFERERPEYVFLAAAKVGGIIANSTYTAEFIYDNMTIASNVIHAAYKNGVSKLLNLGSSCIYPRECSQPMREEYLLTGPLEPTNEPYAIAKIAAIKFCRYYNEQYGTNFISVMPTNLYGPGDNFNLETSHVLPALIRKFHLAKLMRKQDISKIRKDICRYPLKTDMVVNDDVSDEYLIELLKSFGIAASNVTIWGSGEPYREFLYVDDLADACVFLMERYNYKDIGEFVNIGMGTEIKIKEIANLIRLVVGFEGGIINDISKPDGMIKKMLDVQKITSLGWKASTSLKDGIKKAYQAYIELKC